MNFVNVLLLIQVFKNANQTLKLKLKPNPNAPSFCAPPLLAIIGHTRLVQMDIGVI